MPPATLKNTEISRRAWFASLFGAALRTQPANRSRATLCGIPFLRLARGASSLRLLRIHGDEETARQAVEILMESLEAEAWIVDSRTRHVEVLGLRLDPNRMFSRAGAGRNLRRLNPSAPESAIAAALDFLDQGREKMLRTLAPPPGGLWIAAHNNGPGYSIHAEAPISTEMHLPQPEMPRDFFLFTEEKDFRAATRAPRNAVLPDRPEGRTTARSRAGAPPGACATSMSRQPTASWKSSWK